MKLIFICLAAVVLSCNTAKEITKTVTVVDSSAVKSRDSLLLNIKELKRIHERQLQQAKNTGVVFVDDCDTIFLDRQIDCNTDSLMRIIRNKNNKIKILADGSIEAEGKIKSVYSNLEKLEMEKDDLKYTNLQLLKVKDSLTTELSRNENLFGKQIKRGWWNWWFLLFFILGNITMYLYLNRRKIF